MRERERQGDAAAQRDAEHVRVRDAQVAQKPSRVPRLSKTVTPARFRAWWDIAVYSSVPF
jgi:hypothetical protein